MDNHNYFIIKEIARVQAKAAMLQDEISRLKSLPVFKLWHSYEDHKKKEWLIVGWSMWDEKFSFQGTPLLNRGNISQNTSFSLDGTCSVPHSIQTALIFETERNWSPPLLLNHY